MAKSSLTDMQRVILSGAAMRLDRRVLPVPKSIQKNAAAIALSIKPMLSKGLVHEVPAEANDAVWRQDEASGKLALVITAAGMEAIGVSADEGTAGAGDNGAGEACGPTAASPASVTAAAADPLDDRKLPRAGSKLGLLIDALSRPAGATIAEMTAATGWQAHSIRGAISGALKKKLSLEIASETIDGRGRVYRIAADKPVADALLTSGAAQ
jgi:hypothetical protein